MIEFQTTTTADLVALSDYFKKQTTRMSVYSIAYLFMWHKELYTPEYAIVENCLVFMGKFKNKRYFYYPLSKGGDLNEELVAIAKIEEFCREKYYSLRFINVPQERVGVLCERYSLGLHVETVRTWNDYLYNAADFKEYPGKKFGGQRNHVNKFFRNYPAAQFKVLQKGEEGRLYEFLTEFERSQFKKTTAMAKRELALVKELVGKIEAFDLCCGYMEVEGKIVSFAVGEVCGDTLVEHVEKALKEYEGVYPATAQAFVRTFAAEGVEYLNREDDSGDLGLRKSKMQYNPCRMVKKYTVAVDKPLTRIENVPTVAGERVTLKKISAKDKETYARLAGDVERNRYWGFDYRTLLRESGKEPTADFFLNLIRADFKNNNEMALGIYVNGALVGEAVLHNLGYNGQAEVGARLLPAFEKRGYAKESIRLLSDYAFVALGLDVVEAKCFKPNLASKKMLEGAGMRFKGEDDTYFYFYRTPAF